jgi:hypothetical protein
MGNSQSGRFAKAFVNLGFNQDEHGRIVWDGLNARIAGMLGSFTTRFAQPGDTRCRREPASACGDGRACAPEHPGAAHLARDAFNDGALRPIKRSHGPASFRPPVHGISAGPSRGGHTAVPRVCSLSGKAALAAPRTGVSPSEK